MKKRVIGTVIMGIALLINPIKAEDMTTKIGKKAGATATSVVEKFKSLYNTVAEKFNTVLESIKQTFSGEQTSARDALEKKLTDVTNKAKMHIMTYEQNLNLL